jgi:hypothetical protein
VIELARHTHQQVDALVVHARGCDRHSVAHANITSVIVPG